jgi:hypothetical protein
VTKSAGFIIGQLAADEAGCPSAWAGSDARVSVRNSSRRDPRGQRGEAKRLFLRLLPIAGAIALYKSLSFKETGRARLLSAASGPQPMRCCVIDL